MSGTQENNAANPNHFVHELMKGLGPMAEQLNKIGKQYENAGIDKQYRFSFRSKDGQKKDGVMIVFKPSKSISIDLKGVTDDDIKEILNVINSIRKDEPEQKPEQKTETKQKTKKKWWIFSR